MNDREFSDIQIFQHSGKGIPLFMAGHKNCLQADYMLGPGPRLIKKNLKGRGLTKFETGLDCPENDSRWVREFPYASKLALGPTEPPIQRVKLK
jgi:hypothetical protein